MHKAEPDSHHAQQKCDEEQDAQPQSSIVFAPKLTVVSATTEAPAAKPR